MFSFFQYNWQVRDEWLEWCKQLTTEELLMNRVGGVDNILNIVGFVPSGENRMSLCNLGTIIP
ncbi:hypothetical protein J5TS2_02510 [Brevibacillus halotolerans]|nr:hypothetical protein J5TS2_02510 [Brevibacillus halotolerans]